MEKYIVKLNEKYNVVITTNGSSYSYRLVDTKEDKTKCDSFNRDSFLLKARQYVKLSNMQECIIASY